MKSLMTLATAAGIGVASLMAIPADAAAPDCPNGGTVRFGVEPYEGGPRSLIPDLRQDRCDIGQGARVARCRC